MVGLNSDDPAVFNTSLTWQLRIAIGKMGLSQRCIIDSMLHSIDASFIGENEKYLLRTKIEKYANHFKTDNKEMDKNDEKYPMFPISAERVIY